jgi:ubiquinone/menaquinone biosynthesis C-methylase UbiE
MANSSNQPEVADSYNRWAATYDADHNRTRDMAAVVLRQANLVSADQRILEIGCGTGRNTQWLAEHSGNIVAVDFSEEMLRVARSRIQSPSVRFVQHDIRSAWPVDDDSCEVIIAMLVLEHIEFLEPIFAEAARILRPGGELFFCELHPTRQMSGRQAEFVSGDTGEPERITAFLHDISEYLNTGLQTGFELVHLGEWRDAETNKSELPRLLSVRMRLAHGRRI